MDFTSPPSYLGEDWMQSCVITPQKKEKKIPFPGPEIPNQW